MSPVINNCILGPNSSLGIIHTSYSLMNTEYRLTPTAQAYTTRDVDLPTGHKKGEGQENMGTSTGRPPSF